MKKPTLFPINRPPTHCAGCGEPFPSRRGRIEAVVGLDSRLYCYAMTPACAVRAVRPPRDRAPRNRMAGSPVRILSLLRAAS